LRYRFGSKMVRCDTWGCNSIRGVFFLLTLPPLGSGQSGKIDLALFQDQPLEVPPDDEAGRKPDHVSLRCFCDVDDAVCRVTSDVEIPPGLFRMNGSMMGQAAFTQVEAANRRSRKPAGDIRQST
jgi:hypothetical protein